MKLKRLNCSWFASMSIALIALATSAVPAAGDGSTTPVLSVQASLVTPAHISLGEPIMVRCDVKNVSGQTAAVHIRSGTDWYTLVLRDSHGFIVPAALENRPTHSTEPYWTMNAFLQDGDNFREYIPIGKYAVMQHAGKYVLTIHVNLEYALIADAQIGSPEALTKVSCLSQEQDIMLPLLVTPTDPVRLRNVAEALRTASVDGKGGIPARAEMDELFSMPEAQAGASWRALALKPSISTDLVASELEDLHTATGADILAEMLDAPGLVCAPISDRLNRLYNVGSPALRDHIKTIASQRGFQLPETAGAPVVLD